MSALEQAIERERRRLDASILNPPNIRSLNDIKKVIDEFNPNKQKPSSSSFVTAVIKEEGDKIANLHTNTVSKSRREHLIEGFELIKKHQSVAETSGSPIEINGKQVFPPAIGLKGSGSYWVDPIIRQWLGAYREGLLICWDLDGKTYQYDIYNHKLVAITKE